jgi:hypothetical protein
VVCKNEKVYLCDPCGQRHCIQLATRSHLVISIEEDKKNEVLCEICLVLDQSVPAYGFCETCEESELLCHSCAKRHTASNMFKSHVVNTDFERRLNSSQLSAQVLTFLFSNMSIVMQVHCIINSNKMRNYDENFKYIHK